MSAGSTTISGRVLVTGHNGYLGSVLVSQLQNDGYDVVGLDYGYFDECTLVPDSISVASIRRDIRYLQPSDLEGVEAVIHLAALSNDYIRAFDGDLSAWYFHYCGVVFGDVDAQVVRQDS